MAYTKTKMELCISLNCKNLVLYYYLDIFQTSYMILYFSLKLDMHIFFTCMTYANFYLVFLPIFLFIKDPHTHVHQVIFFAIKDCTLGSSF
jgi:hypothetical protein